MKSSISVLFLMYLLAFAGCNCKNETEFCPGISPQLADLIRYQSNDSILFTNSLGKRLSFQVLNSHKSEDTHVDCNNSSYGCNCEPCVTNAYYKSTTQDSIWGTYNYLDYQVNENTTTTAQLGFRIANLYYSIPYPLKDLSENQVSISEVSFGSKTYQNVVLFNIDTISGENGNLSSSKYFMTKIYFQPEYGVIAFNDINSNTLFYLE